jgi:hypothetical protein
MTITAMQTNEDGNADRNMNLFGRGKFVRRFVASVENFPPRLPAVYVE